MQSVSLKEVVKQGVAEAQQQSLVVPIQLADDASLNAFVAQVLKWAAQPQTKADIEQGKIRFSLAAGNTAAVNQSVPVAQQSDTLVIKQGVITEAKVRNHGGANVRCLQVGPQVVITPSAKDCLRKMNVTIERLKA